MELPLSECCKILTFTNKDKSLLGRSLKLRVEFWIEEMQMDEQFEIEYEDVCTHFLLVYNGVDAATARFRLMKDGYKIERVSVKREFRNKGLGKFYIPHVIKCVQEERAKRNGNEKIVVRGITDALEFWKKMGFVMYGEPFDEAGIPHRYFYYDESPSK